MTHSLDGKVSGLAEIDHQQKLKLRLEPRNAMESSLLGRNVPLGPEGEFETDGIIPGSYTLSLTASTPLATADSKVQALSVHLLARADVDVGGSNVKGLILTVPPPIPVTGRVVSEGSAGQDLSQTQISLRPADIFASSDYKTTKPKPDGTFTFTQCEPARYAIHVAAPAGTYVHAIEFNRQDAKTQLDLSAGAGGELVVFLRAGPAELTGTLKNSPSIGEKAPAKRFTLVMLIPRNWSSEDPAEVRRQETSGDTFSFQRLDPGQYIAVAFDEAHTNSVLLQEPDFIGELLRSGQSVDLQEAEHKQITLSVVTDAEVVQMLARQGLN